MAEHTTPEPTRAPREKRGRHWWKLPLGIFGGLLVLVLLAVVFGSMYIESQSAAKRLNSILNSRVARQGETLIHIDRIIGFRGTRATVRGLTVSYRVDGKWREAIRAHDAAIRLRTSPFGSTLRLTLAMDSLVVKLWQARDGHWAVPQFGDTTHAAGGGGEGKRIIIEAQLRNGTVALVQNNGQLAADLQRINASGTFDTKHPRNVAGVVSAALKGSAGTVPMLDVDSLVTTSRGTGPYRMHGTIYLSNEPQVKDLRLLGPGLAIDFGGSIPPASPGVAARATIRIDSLSTLARATGLTLPAGAVHGDLVVSGPRDTPTLDFRGSADYGDAHAESVTVRVRRESEKVFTIENVRGLLAPDTRIYTGDGFVDLEHRRFRAHAEADIDLRHLPRAVVRDATLPEGRVKGLRLTAEGVTTGPYRIAAEVGPTELQGYRILGAAVTGTGDRTKFAISSGQVALPGAVIRATGQINFTSRTVSLPFTTSISNLSAFSGVFHVPGLAGTGSASGRITGSLTAPTITASGELKNATFLQLHGRSAAIDTFVATISQSPRIRVATRAVDVTANGYPVGNAVAHVSATRTRVDAQFAAHRPDGTFAAVGRAVTLTDRGTTSVELDTLRTVLGQNTWALASGHPLRMTTRNGRTVIEATRFVTDAGGVVDLSSVQMGPGNSIALAAHIDSVPLPVGAVDTTTGLLLWHGRLAGDVTVSGRTDDPIVAAQLVARADTADRRLPIEQVRLIAHAGYQRATIDSLLLTTPSGAMRGNFEFTYTRSAIQRLGSRDSTVVEAALAAMHGKGVAEFDSLDLHLWAGATPQVPSRMQGSLTGAILLNGPLDRPEIIGRLNARRFGSPDFQADSLVAAWRINSPEIKSNVLMLDSLVLRTGPSRALATGTVPMTLRFPNRPEFGTGGMNIRVTSPDMNLAILPALNPLIGDAGGSAAIEMSILGNPLHPDATGHATLRNAMLRGAGRDEIITNINGDVSISGHGLTIDNLTGREGEGRLTLTGSADWSKKITYDFRLGLHDFTVIQPAMFSAAVTGDFHLTPGYYPPAKTPRGPRMPIPLLSGNATITKATITYEASQSTNAGGSAAKSTTIQIPNPSMLFDMGVEADNNVWLKNRDADIEMAANLHFTLLENGIPDVRGDITLLRGSYTFLDTRFRIVDGTIGFHEVGQIDPMLNVTAETLLRTAQRGTQSTSPPVITVTLSGKKSEPRVSLSSSDGRSQEAIVEALTIGKFSAPGGSGQSSGFSSAGQVGGNFLVRQFERSILQSTGLLDAFDIETGANGISSVSVGKYLFSDVYVGYSQAFASSGTSSQDLSVEYWVSRSLLLRGEFGSGAAATQAPTGPTSLTSGTTYRFGIKVRREF
jgi:autotransporter translocation and assembly factor TamB